MNCDMARGDYRVCAVSGTTAPLSRRELLAGAGAGLCSGLLPTRSFAQARPAHFAVGAIEVTVISDGLMHLPLSWALPKIEEKEARAALSGDDAAKPAIAAQVNVVVLRQADRLVLVDAGGTADFMPMLGNFADRFEQAGFKPADVTDVILTHAHPDHLWGAVDSFDEPRFPRARVHLSLAERDFWMQPDLPRSLPEALQGMASGTQRRLKILEASVTAHKAGVEFLPGVSLVDSSGHTPGHASVLVASGSDALLVGGDALSNATISFQKPDWVWGPDFDPYGAIATRKSLLDRLATDRLRLLGYHLPWPGHGHVERKDGAYRFVAA